jgi:pimeloyl-ACP methyl ester carboxylesterase
MVPTHYALCGHVHIAWQSIGTGARDLLFIPGWVSNVEANWTFPEVATFLERLAGLGCLLTFDKRGTGLSDRVARMPTMAERVDDVRAVLDAARARPVVIVGASEGCTLAALFAAEHPDRCAALALYGRSSAGPKPIIRSMHDDDPAAASCRHFAGRSLFASTDRHDQLAWPFESAVSLEALQLCRNFLPGCGLALRVQ